MAHADEPSPAVTPTAPGPTVTPAAPGPKPRPQSLWTTGMVCLIMLPLIGFIGQEGWNLWAEWSAMGGEQTKAQPLAVGYVGISPNVTFAERPDDWMHDEGERTLLWAGWDGGKNRWFSFRRGELAGLQLSYPLGRETVRVIDRPILKGREDEIWSRVPDDAKVVQLELGKAPTACPLVVIDKVEAINEVSGGKPVLIAYSPESELVEVYDATLDGKRVLMGHSGFFDAKRPVFFDRETESFWVARDADMVAVAGARKGAKLRRIAKPTPVPWATWKADNPAGRVIVGADRTPGSPAE